MRVEHVFAAGTNEKIRISAPPDFVPPSSISIQRLHGAVVFVPVQQVKRRASEGPRGTRVDRKMTVTPEMRVWAKAETPLVDPDARLAEFIDYWLGVPGRGGVKVDWVATWKNDMRRLQRFALRDAEAAKPKRKPNADAWMNQ